MNHEQLRKLGKKYEDEASEVTLWMHPSDSFGAKSLFWDAVNGLPKEMQSSSFLNIYAIAHCFVLSWDGDKDNPLIQYLEQRDPLNVVSGLSTFSVLCDDDAIILLSKAFTSTRRIATDTIEDEEAKKKNTSDDGNEKLKSKS